MNLGRHELLQWVNDIVQAEYPSIESLADGIAYCQIFEAVHPGSINISRVSFITRLPIDCLRNLKLLESGLKKMKIVMTVSVEKMSNGRFQDHIIFTQWLYVHAQKYGKESLGGYRAYERRVQLL
jgi:RP/EB family microtubule-associated protein